MDATNPSNPATPSGLSPGAAGASLYERIGGEAAMMAAADVFYPKLLTDPLTGPFFDKLNMKAQVKKLVGFMTRAFGGPDQYRGRDLRAAHAGLVKRGLSDRHFDAVARHLEATLTELDMAPGLIREVLAIVAGTREEVLNR